MSYDVLTTLRLNILLIFLQHINFCYIIFLLTYRIISVEISCFIHLTYTVYLFNKIVMKHPSWRSCVKEECRVWDRSFLGPYRHAYLYGQQPRCHFMNTQVSETRIYTLLALPLNRHMTNWVYTRRDHANGDHIWLSCDPCMHGFVK